MCSFEYARLNILGKMKYTAILDGEINNQQIFVSGSGTINLGLTIGNYQLLKIPDKLDPLILKGCLITGYPNASESIDDSINIFKGTSYTYKRSLIFNNGGQLEMTAKCDVENDNLSSVFTVTGNIDCPFLIGSEPIIETWEPTVNNNLSGLFRITWKTEDGSYLSADAHSIYSPHNSVESLPILHRYIEIESAIENNILSLRQDSKLFHRLVNL